MFVDLVDNTYRLYDKDGFLIESHRDRTDRGDLFVNELTYFLNCLKEKRDTNININEARKSLEMALAIKEKI